MFNTEMTVALIMVEVLLIAGFLGVIVVISRFSSQIKTQIEDAFDILTSDIRKLREELRSYKDEIDALQRAQRESNKDLNKF